MKSIILIALFLFSGAGFIAQDVPNETNTTAGQPILNDEEEHDSAAGLDRDYYEKYYKYLPENMAKSKAKLEYNLIRNIKREIIGRDYSKANLELIKNINPSNIQYERVTRNSKWVRGIKKALPHILEKDYMYVVKHGVYTCFITFEVNPENYLFEPHYRELVYDGAGKYDIVIPPY
ncbi:hypothetical protein [Leptospira sp. GIMC2001]|uniref:hypothetical protein n=1 Tax=Leptospira sp. GIMC2001 TaxID=1513297 RepID=UPI00234A16E3|nr:hypothetical protein [Leptospira sp. GIMC2001]WCL47714.1 hypothetical protein O4O04_00220 [Leptospira sp. GIMC2001]